MLGRWDISSRGALVRVLVSAAVLFHGPSCSSIRAGSICAGVLSPLSLRISKCRLSSLENPACGDGPGEEGVSSVISIGEVHGSRLWRAGSWGLSSPPRRLSPSLPPPAGPSLPRSRTPWSAQSSWSRRGHLALADLTSPSAYQLPRGPYVRVQPLQSCPTLRPRGLQPARLLCPWGSPGKNPGAGCPALLQGIFPTQGSNPYLLCLDVPGK